MPTLEIGGRKVEVDESFLRLSPEDQQATVEEIALQLGIGNKPPEVSPIGDQFLAGLESNTELPGQTLEQFGGDFGYENLQGAGTKLRNLTSQPENFVSGTDRFINPKEGDSYVDPLLGYGWGNLPAAAAEVGGQMVGDLAVRGAGALAGSVAGPKGAIAGGLAAPALLEFMRAAGPIVKQRLANDNRTEATWDDWVAAAGAAGLSGALNAIGIKNIGILNNSLKEVGERSAGGVLKDAASDTAGKALKEGVTETGQSVIQQSGETIGTDAGWSIDVKQALGEGILGTAAGGTIDAGRNIRPTIQNFADVRAVDRAQARDPFARERAEITQDVNALAERQTQGDRELQSAEITSYVNDLKNQAIEAIKGQGLAKDDQQALIKGLNTAKGLTEQRLNEIAGRSESPDEIRAIARRIQLIRSMTVQQQAHKGLRGWIAQGVRSLGTVGGGAVGAAVGGTPGAIAGAEIGRNWSREVAQRITNAQTQGARIDALVGAKQARRAKLLLDRYGPSEATQAMNTLTERAAAKKAAKEAEDQARADFASTMASIRQWQSLRKKSMDAEQKAKTDEERQKARADKKQYDLAYREARLKAMAMKAANTQARTEAVVQRLESQKALNALTVEATQIRNDLKRKEAEAKADKMDRQKRFEVENLKGKLEMLSLDIKKRQEALKKAEIATKRAAKMASMAPGSAQATLSRIRGMGAKWAKSVSEDDGISNKPAYMSTTEYLDGLRQQAQNDIRSEPNPEIRNLLRETLTDILSLKNNWNARKARFDAAMMQARQIGGEAPQKLRDTLYQLAHYKARADEPAGRQDYGTTEEDVESTF